MKSEFKAPVPTSESARGDWFSTPLGHSMLLEEKSRCEHLVPAGYYPTALQVGASQHNYLENIEVGTRFIATEKSTSSGGRMEPNISLPDTAIAQVEDTDVAIRHVYASPTALPFSDRTHSLIVLPHVLDYCKDPHTVLREVNQVLSPEGYLVICGFNQISLWGTMRLSRKRYFNAPWQGHFYRIGRVHDWLSLLGYDIVGARMSSYRLPLQNKRWRNKLRFMDKVGDRWWPGLGASYIVVGKKREIASSTGGKRLAWHRFIPAIARPANGLSSTAGHSGKTQLRLVVDN